MHRQQMIDIYVKTKTKIEYQNSNLNRKFSFTFNPQTHSIHLSQMQGK